MEKVILIFCTILLVETAFAGACPPNEVWQTEGIDCAKCSNYKVVRCASVNVSKCYCAPGYVRHDVSNECVSTSICPGIPGQPLPPPCPGNSTYQTGGYDCQTCRLLTVSCLRENTTKCYCNPGYVRDVNGNCIRYQDCPKPPIFCGMNEVASNCQNPCERGCEPRTGACNFLWCTEGCNCKPGYVREEYTRACIRRQQCPRNCKRLGASFNTCASMCPLTCQNRNESIACPALCVYGCTCDGNTILDTSINKCVDPSQCPPLTG